MRAKTIVFGIVLIFVALRIAVAQLRGEESVAKVYHSSGIPNWSSVSENIFRGGQPSPSGFGSLKESGIDVVISFRHEKERAAAEKAILEHMGMKFINIPIGGYSAPTEAQVEEFLRILKESNGKRIFVHCKRGAERTGVMLACYRVSCGWTAEEGYQEMKKFRFRSFWYPHLKSFLFKFAVKYNQERAAALNSAAVDASPEY